MYSIAKEDDLFSNTSSRTQRSEDPGSPSSAETCHSEKFPFPEALSILEHSGKRLYGDHFQIHEEDHLVIFKLLVYFLRDSENASRLNISFRKGILLTGPIGCGKTSLMNLMRYISAAYTHHVMKPCRQITFEFHRNGFPVFDKYSDHSYEPKDGQLVPKTYCFDDLGAESSIKYFGNDTIVMAEIIMSRYDLFVSADMITHATTNLTSTQLENVYGSRVRSRLREMCNLVSFTSRDKRI